MSLIRHAMRVQLGMDEPVANGRSMARERLSSPSFIDFLQGLLAIGIVFVRLGLFRASLLAMSVLDTSRLGLWGNGYMLTARFDVPAESVNDAKRALSALATQFGGKLLDAYSVDELLSQFCTGSSDGTDLMMDNQGLNNPLPVPKLVKQS